MNLIPELLIKEEENEKKLIRLWKSKHDNNIALYFFNKYKDEILNVVYSKFNNKFTTIPFEKDDLFHLVWKAVVSCLNYYKFRGKASIKTLIISKTYWLTLREAEKFLCNSELVLNKAYSYEKLFELNKNFNIGKNGQNGINISYIDATKKFIDDVVSFNQTYDINHLKRAIYLRSLGYTYVEISKDMKLKRHYVKKMLDFACEIAKKLYD